MTADYHVVLATIAIVFGFAGSFFYLRSIFLGETKAHPFTWSVYALIDGIIFLAQFLEGGGPGAWVTGSGLIFLIVITIAAFRIGEKRITKSDWYCFIGALGAIVAWKITSDALIAVVILTVVNTLAALPTFWKSYARPFEESVSIWLFDTVKFSLGIFALSTISVTTALFPLGIVVTNAALVSMILMRRHTLDSKTASATF